MLKTICFLFATTALSAQSYELLWQDNRVCFVNADTKEPIDQACFDQAEEFCGWMGMLRKGDRYGLYDLDRGKIYCCEYDKIDNFDDVGYEGMKGFVYQKGKVGLLGIRNEDGKLEAFLPCEYDKIDQHNDYPHCYTIEKGGLFGVYNAEVGRIVVPLSFKKGFTYDVAETALIVYDKKQAAIYNMDGKVVLPMQKMEVSTNNTAGLYEIKIGKTNGLFDVLRGRWAVEPIEGFVYDSRLLDRYYPVWDKHGLDITLVDGETGKPLLPIAEYRMQTSLTADRYILIQSNGKWGAYDLQTNKIVVECTYTDEADVIGQW